MAMTTTQTKAADALRAAMDKQGILDNDTRAGIAAICMGESGLEPKYEASYAHTNDARIRLVFGARVANYTDEQLDQIKADPFKWFELVYGYQTAVGHILGNNMPGDGYKYRGDGDIQLTGKGNFIRYGTLSGHPEIVDNPDLLNDPVVAAQVAVAYIKDRYRGGGFTAMLAAVGNNTGDIEATKRRYYALYLASGEFNYRPQSQPAPAPTDPPTETHIPGAQPADPVPIPLTDAEVMALDSDSRKNIQRRLAAIGFYRGVIDGIWGRHSKTALAAYNAQRRP